MTDRISIWYIGDLQLPAASENIIVENNIDYVKACSIISQKYSDKIIVVRKRSYYTWLQDYVNQLKYPVTFKEKTARLIVAEEYNVTIPEWLTDEMVIKNELLSFKVENNREKTDFKSRLLTEVISPVFDTDIFPANSISELVVAITEEKSAELIEKYPVIQKCLEEKFIHWEKNSCEGWIEELCVRLNEDSTNTWRILSIWSYINSYPDEVIGWLFTPEDISFITKVPHSAVSDIPLESKASEMIHQQIVFFLNGFKNEKLTGERFQELTRYTSGKLLYEFRDLILLLKENVIDPTEKEISVLRERFRSCPGLRSYEIKSLDYCVKPKKPSIKENGFLSLEEWVAWSVEEYMPYRDWQIHNEYHDEEVEKMVASFSDWYKENYDRVHTTYNRSITHVLNKIGSTEAEKELSIVLLIDCLPVSFFPLIDKALRNYGLHSHETGYRFSLLPTVTAYNKPQLISGRLDTETSNYEKILKDRSKEDWDGRNIMYSGNLKTLTEIGTLSDPEVILCNITESDQILHQNVELMNTTYEEELMHLFARIGEAVKHLVNVWNGNRENVSVYVVTDHGACKILDKEKQTFDSKIINKYFNDEQHRFAIIDENDVETVPLNLWATGYKFKHTFLENNKVFFLPLGHNTVRNLGQTKGFLHGGITPEEVIIPYALYKPVKAAWKEPVIRFLNLKMDKTEGKVYFYIQRITTLELEIQNLNSMDMNILRVSIISPVTEIKTGKVTVVPGRSTEIISINPYFGKNALEHEILEIEIHYEISGEHYTRVLEQQCIFKSVMAGGLNLRNL